MPITQIGTSYWHLDGILLNSDDTSLTIILSECSHKLSVNDSLCCVSLCMRDSTKYEVIFFTSVVWYFTYIEQSKGLSRLHYLCQRDCKIASLEMTLLQEDRKKCLLLT